MFLLHRVSIIILTCIFVAAPTFLRKIKAAVPERANHVWAFEDLTANLKPESVAEFTVAVEAWEADRTQPNPFVSLAEGMYRPHAYNLAVTDMMASDHRKRHQADTGPRRGSRDLTGNWHYLSHPSAICTHHCGYGLRDSSVRSSLY